MPMFPPGRRHRRTGPYLNERGQGIALILLAFVALLWVCVAARGLG